jgi:signal transduction histidine kinase
MHLKSTFSGHSPKFCDSGYMRPRPYPNTCFAYADTPTRRYADTFLPVAHTCLARFVGNELFVIFWYRTTAEPELVFGAEVNLNGFTKDFEHLILPDYDLAKTVCVALLDDKGKPVVTTAPDFATNWKRPFVATEVGELLPHWEIGVYLLNPAFANQIAISLQRSVGTAIGLLLCAIGIGGWLIWRDLGRQVRLARQKTDFVSNVSHELKTPLTSIRMFSELLANNPDPDRQKRYSEIIVNESSRLTRLINNVLTIR